jgi:hypothetical protein
MTMTKTETEKPVDIMAEIQVSLNSPTRAALSAAMAQSDELRSKAKATEEEVNRLGKELGAAGKNDQTAKAKALLAGLPISDATLRESLFAAQRRLAVIVEAQGIQQRTIRQLRCAFSEEVNAALRTKRAALVNRIATALHTLRSATIEDGQVRQALSRGGVDLMYVDDLAFMPMSACLTPEDIWFAARRGEGYTV